MKPPYIIVNGVTLPRRILVVREGIERSYLDLPGATHKWQDKDGDKRMILLTSRNVAYWASIITEDRLRDPIRVCMSAEELCGCPECRVAA